MPPKGYCNRCGIPLYEISYGEPDWLGIYSDTEPRPPLCKPCWEEADEDARLAARKRRYDG